MAIQGAMSCRYRSSRLYSSAGQLQQWAHLVLVYDGAQVRLYQDGVLCDQAPESGNLDPIQVLWLGNEYQVPGRDFGGFIDEVRVSRVDRSDDWIRLSYETQKPGAQVLTVE